MNQDLKSDPLSVFSHKIDELKSHAKVIIASSVAVMKDIDGVEHHLRSETELSVSYHGRVFLVRCSWATSGEKGRVAWMEEERMPNGEIVLNILYIATIDKQGNIVEKGITSSECGELTYRIIQATIQGGEDRWFSFEGV